MTRKHPATPNTQVPFRSSGSREWHLGPGLSPEGPRGRREPTPAGPDSAWSWSSFPVGNSELPPAVAAATAGKGRLSHLCQGWGGALPCPLQPHPVPLLVLLPNARQAARQSSLATDEEGRREGGGGSLSPHLDGRWGRRLVCKPLREQGCGEGEGWGRKLWARTWPPDASQC